MKPEGNFNLTPKYAIAGVVVFYNPVKEELRNINSYLNYIEHLYIIDNSEFPLQNISSFLTPKMEYIFNNSNLGIAAALNMAVEKAIDSGFSFLLTMDQDSYFNKESIKILINNIKDYDSVGIFAPFHKNKFFTNPPKTSGFEEVSDVMTSGNILNLTAVKKIGKFNEEYFIDYVDIEYCLRLRRNGFKVLRINDSILVHNEANLSKKGFLGFNVYPANHTPLRWYYKIRNYLYLKKEYKSAFKKYFDIEKINIRNNIIKVLLFEKNKMKKINMILKGYIHYKKNIKGRI